MGSPTDGPPSTSGSAELSGPVISDPTKVDGGIEGVDNDVQHLAEDLAGVILGTTIGRLLL